jgi:hypothetical protein
MKVDYPSGSFEGEALAEGAEDPKASISRTADR